MSLAHGQILGGLSTVPDLDKAVALYRDVLGANVSAPEVIRR